MTHVLTVCQASGESRDELPKRFPVGPPIGDVRTSCCPNATRPPRS